jgi:hypothetical protein
LSEKPPRSADYGTVAELAWVLTSQHVVPPCKCKILAEIWMHRTTVVLADDHAMVREELVRLLQEEDFDVVAAVGDSDLLPGRSHSISTRRDRDRRVDAWAARLRGAE